MSEHRDSEPIFPSAWGWEKYDPAMREFAAQIARFSETRDNLSPKERKAFRMLFHLWREKQIDADRLPPFDEREKREDEYVAILDRLVEDARNRLRAGELATGINHLMLHPSFMEESRAPKRTCEPDGSCRATPHVPEPDNERPGDDGASWPRRSRKRDVDRGR